MAALTVQEQARQYGEFYVPRFEVLATGAGIGQKSILDVVQVTYKDNIKEIDSFELTVGNWDPRLLQLKYLEPDATTDATPAAPSVQRYKVFEPGACDFELRMGYGAKLTSMTTGSVTTLEPTFASAGPATLTVRALNVLHRLRDKQRSQHWFAKRESEIAKSIKTLNDPATQRKISVRTSDKVASKEIQLDYVAQDNQYDIDFLFMRARLAGYVVFVDVETKANGQEQQFLYFGPSDDKHPRVQNVTYELEWGKTLIDFKPVLSTANQVRSVEVRSQDRQKNRPIRAKVGLDDPDIQINRDLFPLLTQGSRQAREEVVTNEPQPTPQQAQRRARAILSDRLKEMVTAHGTTVGLPDLRSGQRIQVKGVGKQFSGTYFVTETTHTLNDSGYITTFTARREQPLAG